MKKIVTILGARPQFIKSATISRVILSLTDLKEFIIHTGQHYDYKMSDLFFQELSIPKPYKNLEVGSGLHGEQTGKMLQLIEQELLKLTPDLVLVYGDTNSTLAGALAASKMHIPVAHVEAGLRSFNKKMPEEINRIVTDHLSDLLFTPTETATLNLKKEGIEVSKIFNSGDVMYDAVCYYQGHVDSRKLLQELSLKDQPFILTTIHRAENTDNPERLKEILNYLNQISKEKRVVFPVHPRTKKLLNQFQSEMGSPNLKIIEPLGYLDMIALQSSCTLIITDSGGVQKEAFMNRKFCLTVRNETEWTELVDNGFNFLVNPISTLPQLVDKLWNIPFDNKGFQPYGQGDAATKIVNTIKNILR